MRVVSENVEQVLWPIMHAIGQDSGSWEGWRCLRMQTPGLSAFRHRRGIRSDICRLLADSLQDKEGTVFLCGFDEILVFCKGLSEGQISGIGERMQAGVTEKTGLTPRLAFFDVCEDSACLVDLYVCDIIPQTGGNESALRVRPSRFFRQFSRFDSVENFCPGVGSRKVLLVEDDPAMRWMVRSMLRHECHLATAQNVGSALSLYRSFRPDVVLLDLVLQGEDGREAMEEIIRSDPGAHIVIFSSEDSMENIAELLAEGARGFIAKPFRKEKLLQYVQKAPSMA